MQRRCILVITLLAAPPLATAAEALTVDLPDYLECASTVGKHSVQLDTNLSLTRDRAPDGHGGVRATPTLLSIGLGERIDLRLETDGAVRAYGVDRDGTRAIATGRADTSIGLKYAFKQAGPLGARLALIAKADLPNGSAAMRGDGVRPKLQLIAEWALPADMTLTVSPGLYRDIGDDGRRFTGLLGGVQLAKGWNTQWSSFVEVSAPHLHGGTASHPIATLDVGVVYAATDDMSIALAASAGITQHSADRALTLAFSRHW